MAKIKLTDAYVAALKAPPARQLIIWDQTCPGLGIRVTPAGSKSWVAQGQCNSKTVRVTLERADLLAVEDARDHCRAALKLMREGISPVERKKAVAAEQVTLREVMEDYLANRRTKYGKPLRDSSKKEMRKHIEGKLSKWCDKPIASITHAMVATRFRELSATAPVSANLTMISLQSLCNWARDKSIDSSGVPQVLPFNPVEMAFRQLAKWNPVTPRTKRVPTNKTGAVWSLLQGRMNPDRYPPSTNQNAALVMALLLTGCRVMELATMKWDQVVFDDPNGAFITFNTKTHRQLKIPLTTQLHALLQQQHERRTSGNPFVFVGKTRKTHVKDTRCTMEFVSEVSGLHITPHDLRRSFVQAGMGCKIEKYVVDLLSGHAPQDVTGTHYLETNDLRWLLPQAQQIADWMEQQGAIYEAQQAGDNVVTLQTSVRA